MRRPGQPRPALAALIELARGKIARMTPEEQAAMHRVQREGWVRGEAELSRLERETTIVAGTSAMTPEEQAAMHRARWESWVRGKDRELAGTPALNAPVRNARDIALDIALAALREIAAAREVGPIVATANAALRRIEVLRGEKP